MPRALLILLISCAYVGCATRRPLDVAPLPAPGGTLRWVVAADAAAVVERVAAGRPFVATGAGAEDAVALEGPSGDCRVFRIRDEIRSAGGGPLLADEVVVAWEAGLRDPLAPHRWLLAPVEGAAAVAAGTAAHATGLRATGGRLEICTTRPTPDLVERLGHPALWVDGVGPFQPTAWNTFGPRPSYAGAAPYLDRLLRVEGGDAALLLRIGALDAAMTYGAAAAGPPDGGDAWQLARAERWDRLYCIAFDPAARWVNDPRLRRFMADRIDRDSMLRYLFAGRGRPERTLGLGAEDSWPASARRPLAASSRPRIPLVYDDGDPLARAIAARLLGEVQADGIRFELEPTDRAGLLRSLAAGEAPAAIVVHAPTSSDPILALLETAAALGPGALDARRVLDGSSGLADAVARRDAAQAAERVLLEAATLVPLVRVEAWLATRRGLVGVTAGPPGVLRFERAGWLP